MTALTLTPSQISTPADNREALLKVYTAGAAIDLAHPFVYEDDNHQVRPAKADSSAHALAIGMVVILPNFYGESTAPAGSQVTVCVFGPVYVGPNSLLVDGKNLYIDKTTAGDVNDTAPTSAYQYAVGRAQGNDTIMIMPGLGSPVSA